MNVGHRTPLGFIAGMLVFAVPALCFAAQPLPAKKSASQGRPDRKKAKKLRPVAPPPRPEPPPPPAAAEPAQRPPPPEPPPTPPPAPPPAAVPPVGELKRRQPVLTVELGVGVLNRSFDYLQFTETLVTEYLLKSHQLPLYAEPQARLEFYPLALLRNDWISGLGVELLISAAPYLMSRPPNSDTAYPTAALRLSGGVRFRLAPFQQYAMAIIPMVGFHLRSFTVGPASDGSRLAGLPNLSFSGFKAGLGLELPVWTDRISVFGAAAFMPLLSSGELVSSAYFPRGSTWGLEGRAGIGVMLVSMLEVRCAFEYERYESVFHSETGDAFVARGAIDRSWGGSATLRLKL